MTDPSSPSPHPDDPAAAAAAAAILPNGTNDILNHTHTQSHTHNHNHNDHHTTSSATSTTKPTPPPPSLQPDPHHHHEPQSSKITEGDDSTTPPLSAVAADLHARVHAFLSEPHAPDSLLARTQRQTRTALEVMATALSRYALSELSLSYNGGKDCLVLLVLFLASLHPLFKDKEKEEDKGEKVTSIPAIYALPPHPFPAVEAFVRKSSRQYHLELTRYTTDPPRTTLRSAFASYLARNPAIRAIFVGTRRTDPHGATLSHFDRTDRGWPDFVRIHPVIDWRYAEIWAFIRHLGVEYCELYDQGYTSLGGTNDTHPNPRLRIDNPDEAGGRRYRPAYELTEDDEERLGRD
ncbi:hypothetical protein M432DRAFT_216824 [Thermoascus aurantiacus ATCC 26904]